MTQGTSGRRRHAACRRRTRRSRARNRTARSRRLPASRARAGTRRTSPSRRLRERSPSWSERRRGRTGKREWSRAARAARAGSGRTSSRASAVEELGRAGDDEVGCLGAERVRLSGAAHADHEPESCRARGCDASGGRFEGRRVRRLDAELPARFDEGVGRRLGTPSLGSAPGGSSRSPSGKLIPRPARNARTPSSLGFARMKRE